MRDMRQKGIGMQPRVMSRVEYLCLVSGVSLWCIMLFMSVLHIFLMFVNWSIL